MCFEKQSSGFAGIFLPASSLSLRTVRPAPPKADASRGPASAALPSDSRAPQTRPPSQHSTPLQAFGWRPLGLNEKNKIFKINNFPREDSLYIKFEMFFAFSDL